MEARKLNIGLYFLVKYYDVKGQIVYIATTTTTTKDYDIDSDIDDEDQGRHIYLSKDNRLAGQPFWSSQPAS